METNNNAGEGRPDAACSALADLLGNLDEWATHYRELGSPVTLSILRARKTLADQSDRIGELLQAVERGNQCREMLKRCEMWLSTVPEGRKMQVECQRVLRPDMFCGTCGGAISDDCVMCGAPQCCSACCRSTTMEILSQNDKGDSR